MSDAPSWDDVKVFLAAARTGGFGAAARVVGTRQSTVSRRVAALEQSLGVQLLERTPTGVELTSAGRRAQAIAEPAEGALRRLVDVRGEADGEASGVVRLALTETLASAFVIPRVLPALQRRFPALVVDLIVSDDAADLARREADLALRFFLPSKGDLVIKRVATLDLGPLVHRRAVRRLRAEAPTRWPWIAVDRPSPESAWLAGLGATPRWSTTSFHTQLELVRAGLGVALLPRLLTRLVPNLVAVEPSPAPVPTPLELFLITPRGLRRAPRVAVVFDALRDAFAAAQREVGE